MGPTSGNDDEVADLDDQCDLDDMLQWIMVSIPCRTHLPYMCFRARRATVIHLLEGSVPVDSCTHVRVELPTVRSEKVFKPGKKV